AEHVVAAAIEDLRIVAGQNERRIPVEAIGRLSLRIAWPDGGELAGADVAPSHVPVLRLEVNDIGVLRIDPAHEPIAAADENPVLVDRPLSVERVCWPAPTAVVLQTAVGAVRPARIEGDMIKLADGHVVEKLPATHAIVGHIVAAIGSQQHMSAIVRIDPEGMLIRVISPFIGLKCLSAIAGSIEADAEDIDVILIAGIDANLAEVHRPGIDAVDARPRFAAVSRFVETAILEAVRSLLILHVLALAAIPKAIRSLRIRLPLRRPPHHGQAQFLALLAAQHLDRDLVAGIMRAE